MWAMNDSNEIAVLKQLIAEQFDVKLDIAEFVLRAAPVGASAQATLFKTVNNHMYLYVLSQSAQVLGDMHTVVRRMNCEADITYPPHGEDDYFGRIARDKFKIMFPGKHITSDEDLRYYKTITPYNPALFRLSKIKGELRGLDRETKQWRKIKDYSYSKIQTS